MLNELNYQAVIKRGKISSKTTHREFFEKAKEELKEIENELPDNNPMYFPDSLFEEIQDLRTVLTNWLIHYNQDIESLEYWNFMKNNERAKRGK